MKKPTLSYGLMGAAVAIVAIAGLMIHGTPLLPTKVYAQYGTNSTTTPMSAAQAVNQSTK